MSSVGIYMPAYNVEKYVIESLNSIMNQTHKDWELIFIDDCSADNTFEIASNINDKRCCFYKRDEHCGKIGKIKNECISKFTKQHEYICHVGSDDLITPNCFETFVNYMDNHQEIGACCGNFICFNDEGKQWAFPHVSNSGEFDSKILLKYMTLFPMRAYRRNIVAMVGGYSNELTSAVDYDLGLKLDEVTKIHRIKEPITYYYRQHSEQVSAKARLEQDLNAKNALQDALKRRKINGIVINNTPPFEIKYLDNQFIWKFGGK
jgi:glycosyltransferase involved in cell wall biosynthesis